MTPPPDSLSRPRWRLRAPDPARVQALAREAGLEAVPEAVPLAQVPCLSEAFLTSSSRGLVPIVRVDDYVIGSGTPGPVTRRLGALYEARLLAYAEPILAA